MKPTTKPKAVEALRKEADRWHERLEQLKNSNADDIDALIPSEDHYRLMQDQAKYHSEIVASINSLT